VVYRIVGQDEANIKQGLISINSPVAKALIGHRIDDEVHINVPSGIRIYEIIEIQYI
jgi:transcription elongation factor GreA